jgi:5-methylcytosine-specific restriction protein A
VVPSYDWGRLRHRRVVGVLKAVGALLCGVPTTCELCRRVVPDERIDDTQVVQEHHLRPEERAGSPTAMLCRPCHDQIHAVFTNAELRERYDSVAALRDADRLADYLDWIRGTDRLDIRVRTSDHVRRQR